MRLIDLCGESTAVLFGGVGTRDSGVGISEGVREQRGDKIGSHALAHLVRSRGAAAKPRNRAREGTLSFFCWCPSASELAMGINKKRLRLSSQPFLGLAERTRLSVIYSRVSGS